MRQMFVSMAIAAMLVLLAVIFAPPLAMKMPAPEPVGSAPGQGNASASAGVPARIVEEDGVFYRVDPDGSRTVLERGAVRIVEEDGVTYRVDPDGSRVVLREPGAPVDVAIDDPVEYCAVLEEDARRSACRRYAELPKQLEDGVAAFNPPREMTRGETATVEFAVARGSDASMALEMLSETSEVQQFRPKVGRFMAAQLKGAGFEISPVGVREEDLFVSGGAMWSWQVKALRAPRHSLTLSAWVKTKAPDSTLKPVWFRTVNRTVRVPVRARDRVSDFLDDSIDWLKRLNIWTKALLALIGTLSSLVVAIKLFGLKEAGA